MKPDLEKECTAFAGNRIIAQGSVLEVATKTKKYMQRDSPETVLIFDDQTSQQVEIDFRGSIETILGRIRESSGDSEKSSGPGRPKLGVTSREISLLPRHWEWLALQTGGASVTLRKLVEEARKKTSGVDLIRQSQDATYKFMNSMAGDLPKFEEALRALYAKNKKAFEEIVHKWPKDICEHIMKISKDAFRK